MDTKKDNKKENNHGLKQLGAIRVSLSAIFGAAGGVIALILVVILIVTAVNNNGNPGRSTTDPDPQKAAMGFTVDPIQNAVADQKYEEIYNTFLKAGLEDIKKNLDVEYRNGVLSSRDLLSDADLGAAPSEDGSAASQSASAPPESAAPMRATGAEESSGNAGAAGASGMEVAADSTSSSKVEMGSTIPTATSDESSATGEPVYSGTNIQEEGVQEADVVKTDGKHIFTINNKNLTILESGGGKPKVLSRIQQIAGAGEHYFEMYIAGDCLVAIRNTEASNKKSEKNKPSADPGSGPADPAQEPEPAPAEDPAANPDPATSTEPAVLPATATEDKVQAADEAGNLTDVAKIMPWNPVLRDAAVDLFDISDLSKPKKTGTLSQSGVYSDSRMIGSILYLVSNYSEFDYRAIERDAPQTYVPMLTENGNQRIMPAGDIAIPPGGEGMNYTVISGIDTAGKGSFVSQKSVFGRSFDVYCAPKNLYLITGDEIHKTESTEQYAEEIWAGATMITKISLDRGKVDVKATAKVPGSILNQFSLDEKDGVLRLVTNCYVSTQRTPKRKVTEKDGKIYDEYGKELKEKPVTDGDIEYHDSQTTALYTLDADLKTLGNISNLAPDENVYSCRFLGDYAYFVTFRQVDPLFTVDLKDPKKPKVVGKLKIPGFSEYLHPYAKGLLFGFGRDADEKSGEVGNLKLSMFDNSDPTKVKEKDTLVLKGLYNSEVSGNHKAILVDARRNLVAFPADDSYLIYTWTEKDGFKKQTEVVISDDSEWYKALRGLFIDNVFYVLSPKAITTFDMDRDFKRISSLTYDKDASAVDAGGVMPLGRPMIME